MRVFLRVHHAQKVKAVVWTLGIFFSVVLFIITKKETRAVDTNAEHGLRVSTRTHAGRHALACMTFELQGQSVCNARDTP